MKPWHALTIEQIQADLAKHKQYSPNRLVDRSAVHWYTMLIKQFKSILILILSIAVILSYLIGDKLDALAIVVVILLNASLGFLQEWKAQTAILSLKKMLISSCRVIRNGKEQEINTEALIPGDVVFLSTGKIVPADTRLLNVTDLKTDEAALTGESVPVAKEVNIINENTPINERTNMAYMGAHIVNGHGKGLVVATGMNTEFGKIAKLTGNIQETQTRLQKHLDYLAKQLGFMALIVSLLIFSIGYISGHNIIEMAMTGIALAVSAVPEGLPAVVTITLALGMQMMARKRALLRHLQAAETLGAVSVICTDKTGTLTKNEMTVQKIWTASGEFTVTGVGYQPFGEFYQQEQSVFPQKEPNLLALLETGEKCNHARIEQQGNTWRALGEPTEAALIVVAQKAGVLQNRQKDISAEYSFNSIRKRMTIVEKNPEYYLAYNKGAPEVILAHCNRVLCDGNEIELTTELRHQIEHHYTQYAKEGLRTLALAHKKIPLSSELNQNVAEADLVFLGFVGLIDPPREEVYDAIVKSKQAGIRVILITGDSPDTAKAVAHQIGLPISKAVTSIQMKSMDDEQLASLLTQDILFARTIPEDKYRIIKLLQAQNQLVAMTGDGINDAPALKQADIGIAMGMRGTDVAKGAADIVLTDDNFASIIAAIEERRRQYDNIRKFVRYLVSSNIGEILAIMINIFVGGPLILLPIQILWVNLVTDSITALSLSVEKAEKNIMLVPPRRIDEPIINRLSYISLALFGSYIGIMTFILYLHYLKQSYALANAVGFTAMVVMANIHALNFRNLNGPIKAIGWFSNIWILLAISSMIVLQIMVIYTPMMQDVLHIVPLSLNEWGMIIAASFPLFIVPELYKTYTKRGSLSLG